ncbi:MAG: ATP-binding cassette domain-containing protein [Mycoplasmataceae bacterium]|jgi:energy-coupling factor transport system ATP-binding protein|nr:ATP-binding cassette domain-containing protein [Mycoplasmataceae bacterium]
MKSVGVKVSKQNNSSIQLTDFSVIFDEGKKEEYRLLENLNYSFEANKIHFIAGNSGSGKTVLISHFNGLEKSNHGKICIFDKPIVIKHKKIKKVKDIRKRIGMVFQFAEYQLFKSTIEKDICFGPLNFNFSKEVAKQRARKYIKEVGLDVSFLPRNPFGLSGGQKRRVAIAGILAIEPDILVFDEPTAGLDPDGEKEMMRIFENLKENGKTIIIVTHSMNQAIEIGDNVVVIGEGKILKSGDTYEIFQDDAIVEKASLSVPLIFKTIKKLIDKDVKYKKLLELKPRTIEELVKGINKINGGKNV